VNVKQEAQAAWLAYRDEYQRSHPWCDARRASRQLRKREFIAGFYAAVTIAAAPVQPSNDKLTAKEIELREWLRLLPGGSKWWMVVKAGFQRSYYMGVRDATKAVLSE
jgi:hypothetical protein